MIRRPSILLASIFLGGMIVGGAITMLCHDRIRAIFTTPSSSHPQIPAVASIPSPLPVPEPLGPKDIQASIDRASKFLLDHFHDSIITEPDATPEIAIQRVGAVDALCVYALIESGQSPDNPAMASLIDAMNQLHINEGYGTYTRCFRAMVLSAVNKPADHAPLVENVEELLDSCEGGAFGPGRPVRRIGARRRRDYANVVDAGFPTDVIDSAYGVLGTLDAADSGAELPHDYYTAVLSRLQKTQSPNGQWMNNAARNQNLAATSASLACMIRCEDYVSTDSADALPRGNWSDLVAKSLAWLETNNNSVVTSNPYDGFFLQSAAIACGLKYFGDHDWYHETSAKIVRSQFADGSWPGPDSQIIDTALNLIFLSRGNHPIAINKLRFKGPWNNHPRDAANLASYISRETATIFNTQVVDLRHGAADWLDAPILYIASDKPLNLTDADFAKIKAYIDAGGLLFTHADNASSEFNNYVANVLAPKLFPKYATMIPLPPNHPLFSAAISSKTNPPLQCIATEARLLMVHSPQDLARYWQLRASKSHKDAFSFGLNLFTYAQSKKLTPASN